MPPLLVGVWDAETQLSIAAERALGGSEVAADGAAQDGDADGLLLGYQAGAWPDPLIRSMLPRAGFAACRSG